MLPYKITQDAEKAGELLVEDGDSSEPTDSWASLELKYEALNRMRSGERSYMVDVEAVEAKELT